MTVSSQLNRVSTDGNGTTTAYPVSFPFHFQTDLKVLSTVIATGVQTLKTITTHYTISGSTDALGHYSNGGTVNFLVAPASTERITIYRDPPRTQGLNLSENDSLPAESQEAAIDYQTMLIQRVSDLIMRALHQPDGDGPTVGELPSSVDRKNKYLSFDSNGDPVASTTITPGSVVISPFMETVLDDASAATARTTLDVPSKAEAILDAIMTASGDLLTATGTGLPVVKPKGANGTVLMAFSGDPSATSLRYVAVLTKAIYGMTYANASGDPTNDLDIAAGGAMDATGAYWITTAALTKQLDASWTVGNNQGGLDTGAIGNSDYYIWAIARSDTGVTDYLYSLSSTAPTMPTNYDFKRLIGWFKRVAGSIVGFKTYEIEGGGLELLWNLATLDIDLANTLTTTTRTDPVKVPLGFSVHAQLNVLIDDVGIAYVYLHNPDLTNADPSTTVAPLLSLRQYVAGQPAGGQVSVRTSATGTIAARAANVAVVDSYKVSTVGFTWARRN